MEYQRRVCLAMNYISKNPDADLSLKKIADAASLSTFPGCSLKQWRDSDKLIVFRFI